MIDFPLVINADKNCHDLQSVCDWISGKKSELEVQLTNSGAVLLRGFPLKNAQDFDQCVQAFNLKNFTYSESLSNAVRHNRTERVFTANEAPPDVEIYLHHEMAQTPIFPGILLFFCEEMSDSGGATPLCQSDILLDLLLVSDPDFIAELEEKGVRYTNVMPAAADLDSGQGRSWQDTLGVRTQEDAEARLTVLDYSWRWQEGLSLKVTTPVLPAIRSLEDGRKVFFNQLIAAYRGWKNARDGGKKAIQFGDKTVIEEATMENVCSLAESITFDQYWQLGDIVLVNNFLVMHGRRPFSGKRKVLASLAN